MVDIIRRKANTEYIVLQEAARKTGYASDYIGWLIRTGKIEGKKTYSKISWQVEVASLIEYCQKHKNLERRDFSFLNKKYLSLKEAAQISGYASDYIGWLIRKGKVKGNKAYSSILWQTTEKTVKDYQNCQKRKKQKNTFFSFLLLSSVLPYISQKRKELHTQIKSIHFIPKSGDKVFDFAWRLSLTALIIFFLFSGFAPIKFLHGSLISAITAGETKTINYYPTVSYGDWQNPENVQGLPDIGFTADINSFNENNSAVYKTGPLQLVIEGFVEESIITGGEQEEVTGDTDGDGAGGDGTDGADGLDEDGTNGDGTDEDGINGVDEDEADEDGVDEDGDNGLNGVDEDGVDEDGVDEDGVDENGANGTEDGIDGDGINGTDGDGTNGDGINGTNGTDGNGADGADEKIGFLKRVKNFFGAGVFAQENTFSAKIKFSFAVGEKEPDIVIEGEITEVSPREEQDSGFWGRIGNKVRNFFSVLNEKINQIAKSLDVERFLIVRAEEEIEEIEEQKEEAEEVEETEEVEEVEETEETEEEKTEEVGEEEEAEEKEIEKTETEEEEMGGTEKINEIEKADEAEEGEEAEETEETEAEEKKAEEVKAELPELDARIIIWWSLDGDSPAGEWQILGSISDYPLSNALNNGYFEYDAPFLNNFEDVENLRIKFEGVVGGQTDIVAYLDSVWLEIEYIEEGEEEEYELIVLKKDWRANETPTFTIVEKGKKAEENILEKLTGQVSSIFKGKPEMEVKVEMIAPQGKTKLLRKGSDFKAETRSPTEITIFKPEEFRPGKYNLTVEFEKDGKTYLLDQDFTWGVLAVNVNKSIYLPYEEAYVQMTVLDEEGYTVCDADLVLEITSPDGTITIFSTQGMAKEEIEDIDDIDDEEELAKEEEGAEKEPEKEFEEEFEEKTIEEEEIETGEEGETEEGKEQEEQEEEIVIEDTSYGNQEEGEEGEETEEENVQVTPVQVGEIYRSEECGPTSVTYIPDYFAYYDVGETGEYQIKLSASTKNGTYQITDGFEVKESVPFDVERVGPTRIYPPVNYEMKLIIKVNQDFVGEVIESVPASFEIISHESTQIRTQINTKINTKEIVWQADWRAGEKYELRYEFDAPDISPYLYLLGPLKFYE